MVKKFTYDCDFAGKKIPVTFYVGDAAKGNNPISFQMDWLAKEKGGSVPKELVDSLMKLKNIADEQRVPFEDLCDYVIKEVKNTEEAIKAIPQPEKNVATKPTAPTTKQS